MTASPHSLRHACRHRLAGRRFGRLGAGAVLHRSGLRRRRCRRCPGATASRSAGPARPIPGSRWRPSPIRPKSCWAPPPTASSTCSPVLRPAGSRRGWCSNTTRRPTSGRRRSRCRCSHHVAFACLNNKIYAFGGFKLPEAGPGGLGPGQQRLGIRPGDRRVEGAGADADQARRGRGRRRRQDLRDRRRQLAAWRHREWNPSARARTT